MAEVKIARQNVPYNNVVYLLRLHFESGSVAEHTSQKGIRTYVGCANCFSRRLRQHNNLIKGGARKTSRQLQHHGDHLASWVPVCLVRGFPLRTDALKFEARVQHLKLREGDGTPAGRLTMLHKDVRKMLIVCNFKRWTRYCSAWAKDVPLVFEWWDDAFRPPQSCSFPRYLPPHVTEISITDMVIAEVVVKNCQWPMGMLKVLLSYIPIGH